jgi:WD40 repeat protein
MVNCGMVKIMTSLMLTLTLALAAEQTPGVDRHGDPLPAGAIARFGTTRLRSDAGSMRCLNVSPDGRLIAGSGKDSIILWDAATGRELRRCGPILDSRSQPFTFLDAAFSPDSRALAAGTCNASADDSPIMLFDVQTGQVSGRLPGHVGGVDRVAFAVGGRLVSGGLEDGRFRVWDLATRQEVRQFPRQVKFYPDPFAVSPDGRLLAAGDTVAEWPRTNPLHVWDIVTGQEVLRLSDYLTDPRQSIFELVFAPDGRTLAARSSTVFYRIEIPSGQRLGTWERPKDLDGYLACAVAGPRLVTVKDGNLLVWDVAAGRAAADPTREPLLMANRSPVAHDFVVFRNRWDLATGRPRFPTGGHTMPVEGVAVLPDGRTVATWDQGEVRFWEMTTGQELRTIDRGPHGACVALAPDGRTVAVSHGDRVIRLYDTMTGREVRSLTTRDDPNVRGPLAYTMLFAPDGRTLTTLDGWMGLPGLRTWDLANGRLLRESAERFSEHVVGVFSPDGATLYTGHWERTVRQWDAATGRPLRTMEGHPAFVPTDISEMTLMRHGPPRPGHQGPVTALAITPDGKRLISSGDVTVRIWETVTGRECAVLQQARAYALAVSPTGTLLAVATDEPDRRHRIDLWDLPAGRKLASLDGHRGLVQCLAFSPDGRRLVSGSADTTALVWDVSGLPGPRPALKLPDDERSGLWGDLADADCAKAFRAVNRWVAAPEAAVAFFHEQLAPVQPPAADHLARMLADLDSPQFVRREQAQRALQSLGSIVEPWLREALTKSSSTEVRHRLDAILADGVAGDLRVIRAVEVLEHIGTADARQILQRLAGGAPNARLTREAKASLERLARRSP